MANLLVLIRPARACRMSQASAEKLEHTGPVEKKRVASVPQREQLTSTPEQSLPKGKGTEPSVQSTRSYGGRESRRARAAFWRHRGHKNNLFSFSTLIPLLLFLPPAAALFMLTTYSSGPPPLRYLLLLHKEP